ncbi:MAG: adenosylcobinamide-GDP ribazoletransferase [Caldilineaceae bacterium]
MAIQQLLQEITVAIGFLTILPVPTVAFQPGLLGRAGRWFPLIGLLIGLLLWGGYTLLSQIYAPLLVAAATTALWAILTGGLHLDGLADCCDGLLAPVAPARRLEIMRDPRSGAFAVIGLILLLLLKTAALATMPTAGAALLVAPTGARWLLLWIARQPAARSGGLGAEFQNGLTPRSLLFALLLPLVLVGILHQWQLWPALLAALIATWLLARFARQRLGGVTGDVYGLTVEVSELVILLICSAQFGQ